MNSSDMNLALVSTESQRRQWDEFASGASMYQCLWWAEPLAPYGVMTHVLGCWREGRLVGGGLIRSVPMPFLGTYLTECVQGPIFLEWDSAWADPFVQRLKEVARAVNSHAVVVRGCPRQEVHEGLAQAFQRARLKTTVTQGTFNAVLSLQGRTMEELRKHFNHGTKQRVKKGLTGPLRIAPVCSSSDLRLAYDTWVASMTRKNLQALRPFSAFEPVMRHCIDNGLGLVFAATLDGRMLASLFVTYIGDTAIYVMGGYTDEAQSYHPTHALQYVAIQEAIQRGMEHYSFGPLSGAVVKDGVGQFKLGFGAVPQEDLLTITWERSPWVYHSIEWFRRQKLGKRVRNTLKRHVFSAPDRGANPTPSSGAV